MQTTPPSMSPKMPCLRLWRSEPTHSLMRSYKVSMRSCNKLASSMKLN